MAMAVSNDITKEDLECVRHDYMAPGVMTEGMVAQGSFSVILLVRGKSSRKSRWVLWVNNWLHN